MEAEAWSLDRVAAAAKHSRRITHLLFVQHFCSVDDDFQLRHFWAVGGSESKNVKHLWTFLKLDDLDSGTGFFTPLHNMREEMLYFSRYWSTQGI
jgi:hypothetical protein